MADDRDLASVDYATLRFGHGTRNTSFSTIRVVDLNQCAPGGLAHHYLWSRSMSLRTYERHYEENVRLPVGADEIFSYADDFSKLSSHMNKSSSMMMGGSMQTSVDQARGQAIGSHVRMKGSMMGIELSLDEVVTERKPPHYKAWETTGRPRLLVIDNYRLGFEITEQDKSSKLRVFIDYNLPTTPSSRWLGLVFGKLYAKWCVQQMVDDARKHFMRRLLRCSRQYEPSK
jgi:hypothetical protein